MTKPKSFFLLTILVMLLLLTTPAFAETATLSGPIISVGSNGCAEGAARNGLVGNGSAPACNSASYFVRITIFGKPVTLLLIPQTTLDLGVNQKPYQEFNQQVMKGELKFGSFDDYLNTLQARGLIHNLTAQQREIIRNTYYRLINGGGPE